MEPQQTIPQPPQNNTPTPYIGLSPELPPAPPEPKNEGWQSIVSTLAILIAAPVVAVILTTFVFQSYEVDGRSMETTLSNHDRLLVLKLPKTVSRITHNDYVPNRGEVVIFSTSAIHDGQDTNGSKQLIKRVIGLPGDRVVVQDGSVIVYNKEHPEGFNPDKTMPYGSVIDTTTGNVDLTVGPGEIFVCGDNRSNSLDSRFIGTIPSRDIVGKLIFRIYPLSDAKVF